jgi:hypothetical protein
MPFGFNNIKCVVCNKEIEKNLALKAHEVYFCSDECRQKYEADLKELQDNFHLEDCC